MIYLDAAATSLQKPPSVARAVAWSIGACASVGRGGHAAAERAAQVTYACRTELAGLFDCEPEQVVFTMNATHGLNLAIASVVPKGGRVLISHFEHNAVTRPLHARHAEIRHFGTLFDDPATLEAFRRGLETKPDAVVCTHVSNVFGYILPIGQIAALCREADVPLVIDASQSAGTLPLSLRETGAAFVACPGHKGLLGPQGTGILLCAHAARPLLFGGTGSLSESQEMPPFLPDRLEAGTHNVCGLSGLLEGVRYVRRSGTERLLAHEQALLRAAVQGIEAQGLARVFRGAPQSGVLSVVPKTVDCEEAAQRLADAGIAVRAGLHCAPTAHRAAGTLQTGTLRLSFSPFNTMQEIRHFLNVTKKLF